jgi:hypothetical protein
MSAHPPAIPFQKGVGEFLTAQQRRKTAKAKPPFETAKFGVRHRLDRIL